MVLNQLFSIKPPLALVNKIIQKFGLKDIHDSSTFTTLDIDRHNTIMNIFCPKNKIVS